MLLVGQLSVRAPEPKLPNQARRKVCSMVPENVLQGPINRVLELGELSSAKDIRQWARRSGYTGEVDCSENCVLANIIRGGLEEVQVSVTGDKIILRHPQLVMTFEATEHIWEFVENFDSAEYPELINHPGLTGDLLIIDEIVQFEVGLQLKQVISNNEKEVLAHVSN